MFSESYLQDLRMLKMVHPNGNALLNLFNQNVLHTARNYHVENFKLQRLLVRYILTTESRRDKLCIRLYFKRLADV